MSRTVIRRRAPRSRVGRLAALVVSAALVLTGCEFSVYEVPLPGGADVGENPYTVTVKFRDVLDLVPQSAVKVNDVSVGRVESIEVDGYNAEVELIVNESVTLPDNALAEIRQTSLLGEKFVQLEAPPGAPSPGRLADGDIIPLERSSRNPEVEEVFGALSLLLNGGGVAQLKTITVELNKALEGRESDVKSVLTQLDQFTGQLDDGKEDIIDAIESVNELSITLNQEEEDIKLALDELPAGLDSIDQQRDDLVRMLDALNRLSNVAVGVIRASKAGTIESFERLDPILTKLADAGDAFPKSLQVLLTYPFIDAVVGENPAQARNIHFGDYTNLSAQIDIDLSGTNFGPVKVVCGLIGDEAATLEQGIRDVLERFPDQFPAEEIEEIIAQLADNPEDLCQQLAGLLESAPTTCEELVNELPPGPLPPITIIDCEAPPPLAPAVPELTAVQQCFQSGNPRGAACGELDPRFIVSQCTRQQSNNYRSETCRRFRDLGLGLSGGGGGGGGIDLPRGLGRAAPGGGLSGAGSKGSGAAAYDSGLGAMLIWGMVSR